MVDDKLYIIQHVYIILNMIVFSFLDHSYTCMIFFMLIYFSSSQMIDNLYIDDKYLWSILPAVFTHCTALTVIELVQRLNYSRTNDGWMLQIDFVECITTYSKFHFEPNISRHNVCQYHERYAATGYKTILYNIYIIRYAYI